MRAFFIALAVFCLLALPSTFGQLLGWGDEETDVPTNKPTSPQPTASPLPKCPAPHDPPQACPLIDRKRQNIRCPYNSDSCICAYSPLDDEQICVQELDCAKVNEKQLCAVETSYDTKHGRYRLDVPRDATQAKCPKGKKCVKTCCSETLFVCMDICPSQSLTTEL